MDNTGRDAKDNLNKVLDYTLTMNMKIWQRGLGACRIIFLSKYFVRKHYEITLFYKSVKII